jgi:PAS domain S-box-containing protein
VVEVCAVAVLYYLTARLGRMAAPPPGIETVVWPPSGIALAALLILGNRVWPGIWLGAFLANNWTQFDPSNWHTALSMVATGAGIDTGSLLQSLAGAAMMRRYIGERNPFDRVKDALAFVGMALAMCVIGSLCGVMSLCLGGFLGWGHALQRWITWWVGDAGGVLIITPAILSCWYLGRPRWEAARWREAAFLFSAVVLYAIAVFVWWRPETENKYPADLLILPLVAWVAVRFTQREVSLLVLIVLAIAVAGTVHGSGPFGSAATPWSSLPIMQSFIGILSILSVMIAAAVAERRRAEEALQESEHWLMESQRISRVGSYVFDINANTWTSSSVLDEIFGIGADFVRTTEGWSTLIHPEDRDGVLEYLRKEVLGRQKPFDREYRIIAHNDGKIRWVHGLGELYRDATGRMATLAGTIQDVTDQKHLEGQLRQAQKMESIGRLAGGVAHDFNNLLTVINGYSDLMLMQTGEQDPLRSHLMSVRKAGERATALTQQLLAFSRRQILQPQVLDLNAVITESEGMLLRLIEENIRFVTVLAPSLGMVSADPTQMSQILLNLVVNSRDAMPQGGLLRVETCNATLSDKDPEESSGEVRTGNYVMLEVSDSGVGMDENTRRHLFEPFFTTKGPGKGTGLGLAMVYGIVKQSGGVIRVESAPGMGTTVRVYLPRVSGKPGTMPAAASAAEAAASCSGTVLLVEDQENVRRYVALVLDGLGYRVLEADCGPQALSVAVACGAAIDLLITDVVMPGMTGPDLARQLRERVPRVKVLYMSGYTDDIAARHGVTQEGVAYLQKPFGTDALALKVREVLEN